MIALSFKKKVIITGANGFLGRHLYEKLILSSDYEVFRFVRNNVQLENDYNVDIRNKDSVEDAIFSIQPHIVFHLAADIRPSRSIIDLEDMIYTNIIGTMNLLSAIVESSSPMECFLNVGSCEEYGDNEQPFKEDLLPRPVSMYSGTKASTTILCEMLSRVHGVPVVTARPSLLYGPGQHERFFIVQAINKLLANEDFDMTLGEQTRDFLYVDDAVDGLIAISRSENVRGQLYNLTSGSQYPIVQIVSYLKQIIHSSSEINIGAIPYRNNEVMSFNCPNEKLKVECNWEPKVSLLDGLIKTVEYYKNYTG